jgi:hypothetical protein
MRHLVLLLPAIVACNNPGGADSAAPDDASTDVVSNGDAIRGDDAINGEDAQASDAQTTAHFGFSMSASGECNGTTAIAQCPVYVRAFVADLASNPLDDATVTVNDQPVPLATMGLYQAAQTGYAPSYHAVITRGGETLEVTIPSPSDFTSSITPDPPLANMPSTLTWTPTTMPGTSISLMIQSGALHNYTAGPDDTGSFAGPAEAFPVSGTFQITFLRSYYPVNQINVPRTGGPNHVSLSRKWSVVVP